MLGLKECYAFSLTPTVLIEESLSESLWWLMTFIPCIFITRSLWKYHSCAVLSEGIKGYKHKPISDSRVSGCLALRTWVYKDQHSVVVRRDQAEDMQAKDGGNQTVGSQTLE